MAGVRTYNLSGLRKITLTVAVLALLFTGFFWLGYWTGVGHTLIRHGAPITVIPPQDPPNRAPVHQVDDLDAPVRL